MLHSPFLYPIVLGTKVTTNFLFYFNRFFTEFVKLIYYFTGLKVFFGKRIVYNTINSYYNLIMFMILWVFFYYFRTNVLQT